MDARPSRRRAPTTRARPSRSGAAGSRARPRRCARRRGTPSTTICPRSGSSRSSTFGRSGTRSIARTLPPSSTFVQRRRRPFLAPAHRRGSPVSPVVQRRSRDETRLHNGRVRRSHTTYATPPTRSRPDCPSRSRRSRGSPTTSLELAAGRGRIFAELDPLRWELCGRQPGPAAAGGRAPRRSPARRRRRGPARAGSRRSRRRSSAELRPRRRPTRPVDARAPAAYFCAEFAVHALAADLLRRPRRAGRRHPQGGLRPRAAARRRRPDVPPGLLPPAHRRAGAGSRSTGSTPIPTASPAALVTGDDGAAADDHRADPRRATSSRRSGASTSGACRSTCSTPSARRTTQITRWITSRLYVGDPDTRLAQYVLLGVGGMRALRAMGIEPGLVHLNEGHAAFASLELARRERGTAREALEAPHAHDLHDPHAGAGGQRHLPAGQVADALRARRRARRRRRRRSSAAAARTPTTTEEPFGVTQFALRTSRAANGVSRRHGEVAREMWHGLWPGRAGRRGADRPRHQRRPRPDVDRRADARAARPPPRRGLDRPRGRPRRRGRRSTGSPTRSCGRSATASAPISSTTCATAASPTGSRATSRASTSRPPRARSIPTC